MASVKLSRHIPQGILLGELERNYKVVAGVIRNTGSGWDLISVGGHAAINVDAVSNDDSYITIDYSSIQASLVHTFVATPDETMSYDGIFALGASVGLNKAYIRLVQQIQCSVYIYFSGGTFRTLYISSVSARQDIVSVAWDDTSSCLNVAFGEAYPTWGQVTSRNGPYIAQLGSIGISTMQIFFRNIETGALITEPDENMRVFVERQGYKVINPDDYVSGSGNIWFLGVFS